jgi:hypothetical protein
MHSEGLFWVRTARFLPLHAQGPLSDQVADALNPLGQCLSWVDLRRLIVVRRAAGFGAPRPLPSVVPDRYWALH